MTVDELHSQVRQGFQEVRERFTAVDERFAQIDTRLTQIDVRLDGIDERLERGDERFKKIDERFEQLVALIKEDGETTRRYFTIMVEKVEAAVSIVRKRPVTTDASSTTTKLAFSPSRSASSR